MTVKCPTFLLRRLFVSIVVLCFTLVVCVEAFSQNLNIIRIATGSTAGTYFRVGGLIGNMISNPPGSRSCERGGSCGVPGLIAMAQSTNGSVANIKAVYSGEMEMALSQADIAYWSYNGSGFYQGTTPKRSLRALANLFSEKMHIVVASDSDIINISDLQGKRVSVGSIGSGSKIDASLIFSAYGVNRLEMDVITMGLEQSVIALEKNKLDAVFFVSGPPVLAITDLSERMAIRFLSVAGPIAKKLTKIFPFFTQSEIDMGVYGGDDSVQTLAVNAILIVRNDMPDDIAYGITKAIWHPNSAPILANGHLSTRSMTISNAANINGVVLHDAARKFYIDQGVLKNGFINP